MHLHTHEYMHTYGSQVGGECIQIIWHIVDAQLNIYVYLFLLCENYPHLIPLGGFAFTKAFCLKS